MKKLLTRYRCALQLYFMSFKARRWALNCKDPVKKTICVAMFEVNRSTFNTIKPSFIPEMKPLVKFLA